MSTAAAPEAVHVELGPRSYEIVVGPGLIAAAGARIAAALGRRPVRIVFDEGMGPYHLEPLRCGLEAAGFDAGAPVGVPAGEASKSFARYEMLCEALLASGIERATVIVALGGGVVGDLAGFAAATLLRGLDIVQVPTTLLAQVDSAVGGKTAIDARAGKNLVGAFHQPRLVLADTDALDTLPVRELRAGYAEIVKYGLIADPDFFAWLEQEGRAVIETSGPARISAIAHSCRAKAAIVGADERETAPDAAGGRALLNLGHTFAHALETATGYGEVLRHGEAVAIGLVLAYALSAELGLCAGEDASRVRRHLEAVGLPTAPPQGVSWSVPALIDAMARDKKVRDGRLGFVLARGIGQAFVARDVPRDAVAQVLTRAIAA